MCAALRSSIPMSTPAHRGTFAGLVSPAMIDYLVDLGVTAVELLPIHAAIDDRHLIERGLVNYWGYNTIGFFAPDPRFLPTPVDRRLQDRGKTTARCRDRSNSRRRLQSQLVRATISARPCRFAASTTPRYYRLEADRRFYYDVTGTGNTLNLDHPRVLQLVMDSLRYWALEMHVDGFRFDLCTALGRENGDYCQGARSLTRSARIRSWPGSS